MLQLQERLKNLYVFSPKTIRGKFSDISRFVFEVDLKKKVIR